MYPRHDCLYSFNPFTGAASADSVVEIAKGLTAAPLLLLALNSGGGAGGGGRGASDSVCKGGGGVPPGGMLHSPNATPAAEIGQMDVIIYSLFQMDVII